MIITGRYLLAVTVGRDNDARAMISVVTSTINNYYGRHKVIGNVRVFYYLTLATTYIITFPRGFTARVRLCFIGCRYYGGDTRLESIVNPVLNVRRIRRSIYLFYITTIFPFKPDARLIWLSFSRRGKNPLVRTRSFFVRYYCNTFDTATPRGPGYIRS